MSWVCHASLAPIARLKLGFVPLNVAKRVNWLTTSMEAGKGQGPELQGLLAAQAQARTP